MRANRSLQTRVRSAIPATAVLLAGMSSLGAPAAAVAQEARAAVETRPGPVPHLGDHRFVQSTQIRGPFFGTSFRNRLGVGRSDGFVAGAIEIADTTFQIESGDLLYVNLLFVYQQSVKDWLAFNLAFGGVGRLGTETSSLVVEGVNVGTAFSLGWMIRLWESEDMLLSGSMDVHNHSFTVVDLAGFVNRIVEDGGLEPGNTLVRSIPVLLTMGGLRYAYGVNDIVGVIAEANLGYGESLNRDASSEWYHTFGLAVDFDLNPRTAVPVGFAVGSRFYNVPVGDPDLEGTGASGFFRISHTGSENLNLGLELESQWLELRQLDDRIRYTAVALDLQCYF